MTNPFLERYGDLQPQEDEKPKREGLLEQGWGLVTDTASGVVSGIAEGVDEIADTAFELGGAAAQGVKGMLPEDWQRGIEDTFAPAANALRKWGVADAEGGFGVELSGAVRAAGVETPDTLAGNMANDIAQFVTGYVAGGRLLKSIKPTTKVGSVAKAMGQGALADFAAFDPHEHRLSNLLRDYGILEGPIADFLAADEDDDRLMGRVAQTVEGMGLGLLADGFIHSIRGLKKWMRGDKDGAEEAAEAAEAAFAKAGADIDARGASYAKGKPSERSQVPAVVGKQTETLPATPPEVTPAPGAVATKGAAEVADEGTEAGAKSGTGPAGGNGLGARPDPGPKEIFVGQKDTEAVIKEMIERRMGTQVGGAYNPAADLNWSKLEGDAGMKIAAQSISEVYEKAFTEVRGGTPAVTIDEIKAGGEEIAKEIGVSAKELYENLARTNADAERLPYVVAAYRDLHVASLSNFTASVEAAMHNPANEQLATVVRSLEQVANIQASLKGVTSNVARSMRYMREAVGVDGDVARRLAEIEDPRIVNMIDPTGNSANAADALNRMMGRVNRVKGAGKAGRQAVLKVIEPTLWQKATRVYETTYVAGLLSNPGTHLVNLLGGISHNIVEPAERFLAGLTTADRALAREGIDQLVAVIASSGDAIKIAARSTIEGQSKIGGGVGAQLRDVGRVGGISPTDLGVEKGTLLGRSLTGLNGYVSTVHRAMLFGDEFNRQLAHRGRVQASALRSGREAGLKGQQLADYVRTRVDDTFRADGSAYTPEDVSRIQRQLAIATKKGDDPLLVHRLSKELDNATLSAKGTTSARAAVFQEGFEPGSASYRMEQMLRTVPVLRVMVAPFIRTPTNIVKWGLRRTPGLGLVLKETRDEITGKMGPEAQKIALARWEMGTTLYLFGFGLASSGVLTGAGPSDPDLRRKMQEAGWQPYSVKIGDTYYSINRLDPVAMPMTIIATAFEKWSEGGEEQDVMDGAGIAMLSLMQSLKDKTYLQGVADLVELFESSEEGAESFGKRFERFLGQKAGSHIPSIVANNINTDPVMREARTWEEMIARRAGQTEGLDARRNWLGEEMTRPSAFPNSLFGSSLATTEDDPLLTELARLSVASGSAMQLPPKKRQGLDLTQFVSPVTGKTAYDRFQELTADFPVKGRPLRASLEALVNSPKYEAVLTDGWAEMRGSRIDAIGKIMSEHREAAWKQLVRETPELKQALHERGLAQKAAKRNGSDPIKPGDQPGNSYSELLRTFR